MSWPPVRAVECSRERRALGGGRIERMSAFKYATGNARAEKRGHAAAELRRPIELCSSNLVAYA